MTKRSAGRLSVSKINLPGYPFFKKNIPIKTNIRIKPKLPLKEIKRIKRIIVDTLMEARRTSSNKTAQSLHIIETLYKKRITPKKLKDAGFSYNEIKDIYGKEAANAVFS